MFDSLLLPSKKMILKNELTETHEINTNNASMWLQKRALDTWIKFVIRHPNVLFLGFCLFNSSTLINGIHEGQTK